MNHRMEILNRFYRDFDEDSRLTKTRQGQLEFLTTMHYIDKLVPAGTSILEVGAGTGRYSVALADAGYQVAALELLEHNFDRLEKRSRGSKNLTAYLGDAVDLSCFADNSFTATLVLGPLYHLYEADEIKRAIHEAVRVTKPGGVIFAAYLSVYAIIFNNYLENTLPEGLAAYYADNGTISHRPDQLFTGYDMTEFEALFADTETDYITTVSADGNMEFFEFVAGLEFDDELFDIFADYHLKVCEKRELLGYSGHLIYICRKR